MLSCENCKSKNKNLCNHGKNWSTYDIYILKTLAGWNTVERLSFIAEHLGRTENAVLIKMARLNIPFKGAKHAPEYITYYSDDSLCFNYKCTANVLGFLCDDLQRLCCGHSKIKRPCDAKHISTIAEQMDPEQWSLSSFPLKKALEMSIDDFLEKLGATIARPRQTGKTFAQSLEELDSAISNLKDETFNELEGRLKKASAKLKKANSKLNATREKRNKIDLALSRANSFNSTLMELDTTFDDHTVGPSTYAKLFGAKENCREKIEKLGKEISSLQNEVESLRKQILRIKEL